MFVHFFVFFFFVVWNLLPLRKGLRERERAYSHLLDLKTQRKKKTRGNKKKNGKFIVFRPLFPVHRQNLPEKNNTIIVFDITGKAVINQGNVTGNTVKLNVSALQPGIYFIKVYTENGNVLQNKMTVFN